MISILYKDEHIVVINKPSGLLVHRSMIDKRETKFALQMTRDSIGQHVYPVHRLDKPTSGVLIMGLSSQIAANLTEQFSQNQVIKKYIALVRGHTTDQGIIKKALKEKLDKMTDSKARKNKTAQVAITHYKTLWKGEVPVAVGRYSSARYSLVSLSPKTGRKHQIRRHMKHIFHPIIGDTSYGDGKHNTMFKNHFALKRLLLAANEISLKHPFTGKSIKFSTPLCEEFKSVLIKIGCSKLI